MNRLSVGDQALIKAGIESLKARDTLALVVRNNGTTLDSLEEVLKDGKRRFVVPWLSAHLTDVEQFGTFELAGNAVVPDSKAHRDFRGANILNVHFTGAGLAVAQFAVLPDSAHNDLLEISGPLTSFSRDYEVVETELHPGDTVCFLGGVATHQFTSATPDRRSLIASFTI